MDPHILPNESTEDIKPKMKLFCRETTEVDLSNLQDTNSIPGIGKQLWHLLQQYQWLILQGLAAVISYIYIKEAYETWQNSPVVVSVNNTKSFVWNVPFPAITLCSLPTLNEEYDFKGQVSKCFDCEAVYSPYNCSKSNICNFSELAAISLAYTMCVETVWTHINISEDQWELYFDPLFGSISLNGNISSYFKEILPRCTKIYHQEHPLDCYDDCQSLWQTLVMGLTDVFFDPPVCYTFNSLKIGDLFEDLVVSPVIDERTNDFRSKVSLKKQLWTTDNMMDFADKEYSIPFYGLDNLFVEFERVQSKNFFLCNGGIEATSRIGFHHPGEVPMLENTKFYSFDLNQTIIFYITPKMMSAHPNLVDYEPAKRMCYFAHEHKLSLFKFYTQKNCQLECKVNCTLETCGCIPYFLPRQNESVKLCNTIGWRCSQKIIAEKSLYYRPGTKWIQENTPLACICHCLPDCNSLSYDFEVGEVAEPTFKNYSNIKVMYKDVEFSSMVRYSVSSWAEFVAYSLGILGVFNGLCGVGMCEAVYSWTVRAARHCGKLRTNKLAGNNAVKHFTPEFQSH